MLDVIGRHTGIPLGTLRAECEAREASHLVADLLIDADPPTVSLLEQLVAGIWQQ